MKIKCLGSSSAGNCFLLDNGKQTLIVDCGLSEKEIKVGLDFNLKKIAGVCVTHSHADHSKSVKDFKRMGLPVFLPYELEIKKPQKQRFCDFTVTALPMLDKDMQTWQHTNGDGSECPCYAFLIEVNNYKILYVTDTKLCVWNLKNTNLTHILVGLNYQSELLSKDEYKRGHVLTGHMGLKTACGLIEANKTDRLQAVYLCHMGADSTNRDKCISEVQNVAGNSVYVDCAERGKEWELRNADECPF